jgi:hypothetical protein
VVETKNRGTASLVSRGVRRAIALLLSTVALFVPAGCGGDDSGGGGGGGGTNTTQTDDPDYGY